MAEIAIPSVGIAMEEALVVKWLKEEGEPVAVDEPVAEIETDKATMELVSPADGTLGAHLYDAGAIVPVGTSIARVVVAGEAEVTSAPPPAPLTSREVPPAESPAESPPRTGESQARRPHTASPRRRRLASERASAARDGAPTPATDRFRESIAAKVAESWRVIPHFAVTREVDAEPMAAALEALRAAEIAPKPTLTDLFLRALAMGIRASPSQLSSDIGLAVATRRGVVIAVVPNVLELDASGLARARSAAVARATVGRLDAVDLESRPTSTLSNLGARGVDHFTGIVALGQTSLLTVGRAVPRVVASDDRSLSVRTTFFATLNVDHRSIDGAQAADLLAAFATAAETMTSTF